MDQEVNEIMNALAIPYDTAVSLWHEFNPNADRSTKFVLPPTNRMDN